MRLGYLLRTLPQPKAMPKKLPVSVRGSGRLSSTKVKTSKPKKLQCVKTILILTVRNEELDAIESAFKKCRGANRGGLQFRKNSGFYEGFFHKNTREQVRIVVGQFRDTGNEMSAVETSHYITKCEELYDTKPLYAILVGICAGSRKRHAELGDVVVPPYLFDKSVYKIEWVKGKKGSRGKKVTLNEIRTPGIPDAGLFGLCRRVAKEGLWAQTIDIARPEKPRTPYVHDDPLFTANAFLQDGGDYLEECRLSINRKVLAYEMEAGGFANACHRARVPFLVIRGISDFADDKTLDKTFWPYAGRTAAALALAIAKLGVIPD
jgi:nucleoside phosphorylase